jgi:hypothetical protein
LINTASAGGVTMVKERVDFGEATMARIFQFPKMHNGSAGHAVRSPPGGMHHPWRELWENPITQALYRLFVALVVCTWPILRWFVGADLLIQLLRMVFVGGLAGLVGLLHFLLVGVAAYMVLHVPPLPHK